MDTRSEGLESGSEGSGSLGQQAGRSRHSWAAVLEVWAAIGIWSEGLGSLG